MSSIETHRRGPWRRASSATSTDRSRRLLPTSPGYDAARRIWNGAVDRHPGCIARCTGAADVDRVGALRARPRPGDRRAGRGPQRGRHRGVRRRGRHRPLGDASRLGPRPGGRTAWVPGWCTVGRRRPRDAGPRSGHHRQLVGHTGVAGLTLGGGIGVLMRSTGSPSTTCLPPRSSRRRAASSGRPPTNTPTCSGRCEESGGNFGVVTAFRFSLHPIGPTVMAGPVFWASDDTTDVLRFYRDFAAEAPDELGSVVRLGTIPPLPVIPEDLRDRPLPSPAATPAPSKTASVQCRVALRRFGTPLVDLLAPSPYVAVQGGLDDTVLHGWHYYWKATTLAGLSDDAIAVIAEHAYAASSPRSYTAMFHMGGAVARVPHRRTPVATWPTASSSTPFGSLTSPASTPRRRPHGRGGSSKPSNRTALAASTSTSSIPANDSSRVPRPTAIRSTGDSPKSRPSTTLTTPSTTTRTSSPADAGASVCHAGGGTRTPTLLQHRDLNPACLPVSARPPVRAI